MPSIPLGRNVNVIRDNGWDALEILNGIMALMRGLFKCLPRQIPFLSDNGSSGQRPHYHPNYSGAFVFDPDGHNTIEAICHDPAQITESCNWLAVFYTKAMYKLWKSRRSSAELGGSLRTIDTTWVRSRFIRDDGT